MKKFFLIVVWLAIPQWVSAQSTQFYLEDNLNRDLKVRIYIVADMQARYQVQESLYSAVDHAREALNKMSTANSSSELGRINARKRAGNYSVGPELAHAIASGLEVAKMTRGAFDFTTDSIDGNYTKVKINRSNGALTLKVDNMTLSVKHLLRGALADVIADDLGRAGWRNCLVKIETVFVSRGNDAGGPWKIPVMTPTDKLASRVLFYKAKQDLSAATFPPQRGTGTIVDPRTKQVTASDLRSTSIFAKTGAEADALAAALYVMGMDEAKNFLARNKRFRAVLGTATGELIHLPHLGEKVPTLEDEARQEGVTSTPTFSSPSPPPAPHEEEETDSPKGAHSSGKTL